VQTYGVDLKDGHFEICGVSFWPFDPYRERYHTFDLVFYRDVQQHRDLKIFQGQSIVGVRDRETIGYTLGYIARNGNTETEIKRIIKI
jgi:hypothetical protein